MSIAFCSVKLPTTFIVKDEVLEYRELVRALLKDIRRVKGERNFKYAKSLCFRIEYYDYPVVITQLEGILNA